MPIANLRKNGPGHKRQSECGNTKQFLHKNFLLVIWPDSGRVQNHRVTLNVDIRFVPDD
jgi:hypothetical protein